MNKKSKMYFDKKEFDREMYLLSPDNDDRVIVIMGKLVIISITAFVMMFTSWKIRE